MSFRITFPNSNSAITFSNPYDVYAYIVKSVYKCRLDIVDEAIHEKATNVQGWCELANAGEIYEDEDFSIECVYNSS